MYASRRDLPSLTALRTFESAARLESFKAAAGELNVTAGAVSRQVKTLESDLGTPVFERRHRGVVLTAAGRELFQALASSFGAIAGCIDDIRAELMGRHVTIGTPLAFAHYWLVPRIGGFWAQHDVVIDQVNSDREGELLTSRLDFCLRYGTGGWAQEDGTYLFGDVLYPVASPGILEGPGWRYPLEALSTMTLIDVVGVSPSWTRWREFLARAEAGWEARKQRQVTNYIIAVEAARSGQGVALGWHRLIAPLVERGELMPVSDVAIPATGHYYLNWRRGLALNSGAEAVRDWLVATAQAEPAVPATPPKVSG